MSVATWQPIHLQHDLAPQYTIINTLSASTLLQTRKTLGLTPLKQPLSSATGTRSTASIARADDTGGEWQKPFWLDRDAIAALTAVAYGGDPRYRRRRAPADRRCSGGSCRTGHRQLERSQRRLFPDSTNAIFLQYCSAPGSCWRWHPP